MIFRTSHGNFGDDLNSWLWPKIAPDLCDAADPRLFLGIGTILSRSVPEEPMKIVFGSGSGTNRPPDLSKNWFFYAVRGPLTAERLGLPGSLAICDPGILVRQVSAAAASGKHDVAFMPHFQSFRDADWTKLCERAGIFMIDPRSPVEEVIGQIRQTKLLLAEAMHGAIVADALRVPWVPIRMYGHFLEFKWRDWTQSIEAPLNIVEVPPVFERPLASRGGAAQAFKKGLAMAGVGKRKWRRLKVRPSSEKEVSETLRSLEQAARVAKGMLSDENFLASLEGRLLQRLSDLKKDWAASSFKLAQKAA